MDKWVQLMILKITYLTMLLIGGSNFARLYTREKYPFFSLNISTQNTSPDIEPKFMKSEHGGEKWIRYRAIETKELVELCVMTY